MVAFGVFGVSTAMQPVLRLIRQAASSGRSVLICGEAGTGRGRIAQAIHALAHSRPESFVAIDCAAAGEDDLETELFGADGGSTKARGGRPSSENVSSDSLLWRALGGTLYLINVVEMPSLVQARLARVIRDRHVVGARGLQVRLDCRLITAVEPGFESAVAEGRLRPDLHQRLAALRIDVPPLRERKEDIPELAGFFLEQYAQTLGVQAKQVSPSAAMLLQALPWQGNAWELRGLVESLAQWVPGDTIDLADVLASVRLDPHARSVAVGGTLRVARRHFEREYIHAVLQQFSGQVTAAARPLGIQRTNLYRKMRSLGLTPAPPSHFRSVNHRSAPGTLKSREMHQRKRR
jgi:DNA-binding NtrC family response regulator